MKDHIITIAGIMILVLGMVLLLSGAIIESESYSDNLPCYDRHNNIIQGQTCSGTDRERYGFMVAGFFSMFAGILITFLDMGDSGL